MSNDRNHPLSMSHTGSFGDAARGDGVLWPRSRSRRLARMARLWPLMAVALIALGPVAAFVAYEMAEASHHERVQVRFEETVQRRIERVDGQLAAYREVLHAVSGLYDASERVTKQEFEVFTRQARGRHPCIDAIAWAPAEGGEAAPVHRIAFIEPRERFAHLLRLNLRQSDVIRPTLERALEGDGPVLSAPLTGDLSGDASAFGIYVLGVFRDDAERARLDPQGAVFLTFRFEDLIAPCPTVRTAPDMRVWLFDITAGEASQLAGVHGERTDVAAGISASQDRELGGRQWRFTALPTRHFMDRHRSRESLGIAAVVLLVWELLAGLLLALSHASRSNAVRRQGRNVARIMQSLGEAVVVAGADGHVRLANGAARALIGGVVDNVDVQTFERAVRCARDGGTEHGPEDTPLKRAMRGETFDEIACFVKTPARPEGVYVHVSGSPLRDEWGQVLGGVLAIRDDTERRRNEEELRAKDAKIRARDMEMELAADVQRRFYPREAPVIQGLQLAGAVQPADETCGDYYDYLKLPDGSTLIAVGDVSGHGLGPALVMAETRAYVRSLARAGYAPDAILERCNLQLCQDLADGQFVTMLLIHVSPGGHTLSYASAGHTPALLVGADGVLVRELTKCGPPLGPLGIEDDRRYPVQEGIAFRTHDVLVLMTDGVTEASPGGEEYFEETGVLDVVARHCHRDADAILREIGGALERFAGEECRRDDVTLVVCKRTAEVPARRRDRSLSSTWTDHRA